MKFDKFLKVQAGDVRFLAFYYGNGIQCQNFRGI